MHINCKQNIHIYIYTSIYLQVNMTARVKSLFPRFKHIYCPTDNFVIQIQHQDVRLIITFTTSKVRSAYINKAGNLTVRSVAFPRFRRKRESQILQLELWKHKVILRPITVLRLWVNYAGGHWTLVVTEVLGNQRNLQI